MVSPFLMGGGYTAFLFMAVFWGGFWGRVEAGTGGGIRATGEFGLLLSRQSDNRLWQLSRSSVLPG